MTWLQLVVLAIVQGLTEFLPVSSSAHLILVSRGLNWPDQGLVLDVAVHLGTLLAVIVYFRSELVAMASAWLERGNSDSPEAVFQRRLGLILALSSLPVLVVGFMAYGLVEHWLRDVRVIASATLFFGLVLWLADRFAPSKLNLVDMSFSRGLLIGLAQVLALVPGTSRSGITLTMARGLGFDAHSAARFSFLLSIPVIAVAGFHGIWVLVGEGSSVAWQQFSLAVVCAAISGWLCIAAFLALLKRLGLTPFIIYRLLLGVVLLVLIN